MKDNDNSHIDKLIINQKVKINDDVFFAISEKNKEKLIKALDEGFNFDKIYKSEKNNKIKIMEQLESNSDSLEDRIGADFHNNIIEKDSDKNIYPLINVISSRWDDGWDILYDKFLKNVDFSNAIDFPAIWEVALHYANLKVLKDIKKLGFNTNLKNKSGITSIHILFESMNYTDLISINPENIIDTIFWLQKEGVDIYEPYPGKFEDIRDNRKAGNSIWTYSLREKNYSVLKKIIPDSWINIIKSPRWKHYVKILLNELKNPLRTKTENKDIKCSWNIFKTNFFEFIMEDYNPEFSSIKDFIYILSDLSKEERIIFWKHLNKQNIEDYNRTTWFSVAKEVTNPDFYNVIKLLKTDGFNIEEIFLQKDSVNDTALDIWICYFESIPLNKIPKDDFLKKQIEFYSTNFSLEVRKRINEDKGFSFNDFMVSKISNWEKYDKKYTQYIKLISN